VNARSRSGETPLHYAARAGSARVVKLLLESGADPRAKDARGRTPSYVAFRAAWAKRRPEVYFEIYEMLLKAERRRSG
jgi:cytohesin